MTFADLRARPGLRLGRGRWLVPPVGCACAFLVRRGPDSLDRLPVFDAPSALPSKSLAARLGRIRHRAWHRSCGDGLDRGTALSLRGGHGRDHGHASHLRRLVRRSHFAGDLRGRTGGRLRRPGRASSRGAVLLDGDELRPRGRSREAFPPSRRLHCEQQPTRPTELQQLGRRRSWLTTTRSSSAAGSTRWPALRCWRGPAGTSACSSAAHWLGGAIQTAEITEPGFHHDVFSAWHPLWVGGAAHAELGDELAARGLEYLNTELSDGDALPGRRGARSCSDTPTRTRRSSTAMLPATATPGGACSTGSSRTPTSRSACSAPSSGRRTGSRSRLKALPPARAARPRRVRAATCSSRAATGSTTTFASERAHGLLAPWVLHTGLGPDAAASGLHDAGDRGRRPGGRHADPARRRRAARRRARAADPGPRRRLRDGRRRRAGARPRTAQAVGVRTADGETVTASPRGDRERHADAALRTPARRRGDAEPSREARAASATAAPRCRSTSRSRSRRAGRATSGSRRTAIVHLTPGLDGVSRAVNEAERGLLPAEATVVVGQPLTMDPSRAPDGAGLLWIQLQELPWHVKGDAAGELDTSDGTWTEELARALRRPDPGAARARTSRTSSRRSASASCSRRPTCRPRTSTCVHGDPYSGSLALDQNFLWRPFPAQPGAPRRRSTALAHRRQHPAGARASAPAPARSSRSSCSSRHCSNASGNASADERPRLDLADHDGLGVVRRRSRRLPRRGSGRDRDLGVQAATTTRSSVSDESGLAGSDGGAGGAVDPSAAADGGTGRSRSAHRGDLRRHPPARAVRPGVRRSS